MVSVAFSPSDMPPSWLTTPSSQPADNASVPEKRNAIIARLRTLDDLTDPNFGLEVSATNGRIESDAVSNVA